MASVNVTFTFHSGVKRTLFQNLRLSGSWDASGKSSPQWTQTPMLPTQDGTGCDAFSVTVPLDASQVGTTFQWGVFADLAGAPNSWVIVTEVPDPTSSQTTRSFVLGAAASQQDYWFVNGRDSVLRSASLAQRTPVFASRYGRPTPRRWKWYSRGRYRRQPNGYIADDGTGIDPAAPVIALSSHGGRDVDQRPHFAGARQFQRLHESPLHVPHLE